MIILVFSDSHGTPLLMLRALKAHPDAGALVHLGDGAAEFRRLSSAGGLPAYAVKGNCDWADREAADLKEVLVFEAAGKRIMITHGHTLGVKSGIFTLIGEAKDRHADIVCYGHTHERFEKYFPDESEDENGEKKGLYVFNPGSCGFPHQGEFSYGIMDLQPSGVSLSAAVFDSLVG